MSQLHSLPLILLGCLSSSVEEPPEPPTPALLEAYDQEVELALELHRALSAADAGANAFFSPASIASALSMLTEGTRGATRAEFARVLQGNDELDQGALRAVRADLAHRLRAAARDISWTEASGIWASDQAALVAATQEALEAYHGASIESADFRAAFEEVREEINDWTAKRTKNRIKNLLPGGSVDGMTKLVLVNAVHFLGKWQVEFEKAKTRNLPFLRSDGTESVVPFLQDERTLPAAFFSIDDVALPTPDEAHLTVFELPYRGGQLSFVGLIPTSEAGLPELEKRLSAPLLKSWLGALRSQRVDFAMPKLELEPSYNLVPVLKGLGLGRVLDAGTAELGGFFENEGDDLHVTGAFHKAFLKVDELGTEAAAATGVVARVTSAVRPSPRVRADRPYLFLIRERTTGAILFMGRIVHP